MTNKIKNDGNQNITIQGVHNASININIKKKFWDSKDDIILISILVFFILSFCFGIYRGYSIKIKSSENEILKMYITSQVKLLSENDRYYLEFTTPNKNYIYDTQTDSILTQSIYQNNSNFNVIKNSVPEDALAIIGVSGSIFKFYKSLFKSSSKNAKVIFIALCTISTYYVGYWISSRRIPDIDNKNLIKILNDDNAWKEVERLSMDRMLNDIQIDINSSDKYILKHSFFNYIDSTLIDDKNVLNLLIINELKYKSIKNRLINSNSKIYSTDFETIIDRIRYFRIIWHTNYLKKDYIRNGKPYQLLEVDLFQGAIKKIEIY